MEPDVQEVELLQLPPRVQFRYGNRMQRRELLLGLGSIGDSLKAAFKKERLEEATALFERAVAEKKLRAATLTCGRESMSFERGFGGSAVGGYNFSHRLHHQADDRGRADDPCRP